MIGLLVFISAGNCMLSIKYPCPVRDIEWEVSAWITLQPRVKASRPIRKASAQASTASRYVQRIPQVPSWKSSARGPHTPTTLELSQPAGKERMDTRRNRPDIICRSPHSLKTDEDLQKQKKIQRRMLRSVPSKERPVKTVADLKAGDSKVEKSSS